MQYAGDGATRSVPRLVRHTLEPGVLWLRLAGALCDSAPCFFSLSISPEVHATSHVDPAKTYLVTGGLGGLGLQTARALAEPRHADSGTSKTEVSLAMDKTPHKGILRGRYRVLIHRLLGFVY